MGRACGSILGSNRIGRHNAGVQRRWINLLPPAVTFLLGEVVGEQQREAKVQVDPMPARASC